MHAQNTTINGNKTNKNKEEGKITVLILSRCYNFTITHEKQICEIN